VRLAHRNLGEGAAWPSETQGHRAIRYNLFALCCLCVEGKKDFRYYPWPNSPLDKLFHRQAHLTKIIFSIDARHHEGFTFILFLIH
jgi:hypothetical protein